LEEEALTVRLPGVSASFTLKESGPVELLAGIAWSSMEEMVGAVLAPATSAKWVPILRLST